jgi:hypothetical protein
MKLNFKSSVSVFVLLGMLWTPHSSYAMEAEKDLLLNSTPTAKDKGKDDPDSSISSAEKKDNLFNSYSKN